MSRGVARGREWGGARATGWSLVIATVALAACGAKTPLRRPDTGAVADGEVDDALDASPGRDEGRNDDRAHPPDGIDVPTAESGRDASDDCTPMTFTLTRR